MINNQIDITHNSISDSAEFRNLWGTLNQNQRRFCIAMQEYTTKDQAAKAIGLKPDTVYRWPDTVDRVIDLLSYDVANRALDILTKALAKAVMVKVSGLDSDDEKTRQSVASELIDRGIGKTPERLEVKKEENKVVKLELLEDEELARLRSVINKLNPE